MSFDQQLIDEPKVSKISFITPEHATDYAISDTEIFCFTAPKISIFCMQIFNFVKLSCCLLGAQSFILDLSLPVYDVNLPLRAANKFVFPEKK